MTEHDKIIDNALDLTDGETEKEDKETRPIDNAFIASATAKNDITKLKYVGSTTAERLLRYGFDSIEKIANSTIAQVAEVEGIGEKSAQKIIGAAKSFSSLKTLNEYSASEHSELAHDEKDLIEYEEPEYYYDTVEKEGREYEVEPVEDIKELKPWFEEKFKISQLGKSYPHPNRVNSTIKAVMTPPVQEESITYEIPKEESIPKIQEVIKKPVVIHPEKIERQEFLTRLNSELKSLDYHILPKSGTLFTTVDAIAVKQLRLNEMLELLLILPIKFSSFTGKIKISQAHIDYEGEVKKEEPSIKKVCTTYLTKLSKVCQVMLNDLMNSGQFSQMLTNFLKLEISVEKSILFKKVLYRNGPLQYKILLEPLLVCLGSVGFLDKVIPFAYHKSTNIHVIELAQLPEILDFLERKYSLIEEFSESEDLAAEYDEIRDNFIEKIRYSSIPILSFGFVALLLILFQTFFLLNFITIFGYCLIGIYLGVVTFIYIRYLQNKSMIFDKTSLPYYRQILDDSVLILINEQLSAELMAQFSYECIDTTVETQVISKIEETYAEDLYTKSKLREIVQNDKFFEGQPTHKEKVIRKYSRFLNE
ncbi:MAG: helix-hairpin-helix domain-containing protein [Promethearchaeota archaeon]